MDRFRWATKTSWLLVLALLLLLPSCASKKNVVYFQDLKAGTTDSVVAPTLIRVQSGDKLSIVVNSKDPQLSNLFNLPVTSRIVGIANSASQQMSAYTVDDHGGIDFPILGKVAVAGLTRQQIATRIKGLLLARDLIKDPTVTVEFANLYIAILGEVAKPGRYPVNKDQLTVLDAISMAGDLTIYGDRGNIKILRQQGNKQVTYVVNLKSARELFASPAYYLQQGDVIYIEPNEVRARQSTVNGNNVLSTSFWLSVASLATTIALFFVRR